VNWTGLAFPVRALLGAAASAALLVGCGWDEMKEVKEPLKLADGREITVEQLQRGQEQYILYCRPCHGVNGDGRGPAGIGLRPPPRNFAAEDLAFKFGGVEAGNLPTDDQLLRIIKGGLNGTAMLAWDIPDPVLVDIIQYLKTFNPIWTEEEPGELVEISEDPWKGKEAEGIARGKKVYHGLAQCLQCHPAYASKQEIYEFSQELTSNGITSFRPAMFEPAAKMSQAYGNLLLPPDFGRHPVKSGDLLPTGVGNSVTKNALFRTVAAGIGGTAMPLWKGSIPDEDIWAIAYFVDSISQIRDKPEYKKLMAELAKANEGWTPPAPPPEDGTEGAEDGEGEATEE
jgi:mono/diheme cytochrome c family protein